MPWYWSDEIARALLSRGSISESNAADLITTPIAFRREETTVEAAAAGLLEDDEIPLSALAA